MIRSRTLVAILITIATAAAAFGLSGRTLASPAVQPAAADRPQTTLTVIGEGRVPAAPDLATLNLGVETSARSVTDARTQVAQAMDALVTGLTALGIERADIRTQAVIITPEHGPQPSPAGTTSPSPAVLGFRVTNLVEVTVRQLERVPTVIDRSAEIAGDAVRVQSIRFGVADPSAALRQAPEVAIQQAHAKAGHLAALAGMALGKPTSVVDYGPAGGMGAAAAGGGKDMPIYPGQTEIIASLQVVFGVE